MLEPDIQQARDAVRDADALLITAGAGMGVDSGLPDFRGNQGFWKAYPAIAKLGKSFEEMAQPHWFDADPKLAWAFYGHRLNLYRRTTPHEGFRLLLAAGQQKPHGYFVFTSNVDGQFQKAGYAGDKIVECHGSIHHFQCTRPCSENIWGAENIQVTVDEERFMAQEPLPACPDCGKLAQPNIVMFGDGQWVNGRTTDQIDRYRQWLNHVRSVAAHLVIIEVGAGVAIPSVRYQSESVAQRLNAKLIRINPRDAQGPDGVISIPLGALEGVRAIMSGDLS